MATPTDRPPASRMSPMPLLFARYVAGQIDDPHWHRCMQVLDAGETTPEVRLALAAFLSDAFTDLEPEAVRVPAFKEMQDLMAELSSPTAVKH